MLIFYNTDTTRNNSLCTKLGNKNKNNSLNKVLPSTYSIQPLSISLDEIDVTDGDGQNCASLNCVYKHVTSAIKIVVLV